MPVNLAPHVFNYFTLPVKQQPQRVAQLALENGTFAGRSRLVGDAVRAGVGAAFLGGNGVARCAGRTIK